MKQQGSREGEETTVENVEEDGKGTLLSKYAHGLAQNQELPWLTDIIRCCW